MQTRDISSRPLLSVKIIKRMTNVDPMFERSYYLLTITLAPLSEAMTKTAGDWMFFFTQYPASLASTKTPLIVSDKTAVGWLLPADTTAFPLPFSLTL